MISFCQQVQIGINQDNHENQRSFYLCQYSVQKYIPMTQIKEVIKCIETLAPPALQESYDNAGLIVGKDSTEVKGVLVCLDSTEAVIEEAIRLGCNLVIAHHPIVFSGLKKLNGKNYVERTIILAIQNNVAIYAAHTNLDNVQHGVNERICQKLGLKNTRILSPKKNLLKKLVTFSPAGHADKVRQALFEAGGGHIGKYDECSFNAEGTGTFRASEGANPHVGQVGKQHREPEIRMELIFEDYAEKQLLAALKNSHPYEEVAYDIYPLENIHPNTGSGMIGELETGMEEMAFLQHLKKAMATACVRYTPLTGQTVTRVAVCGGSGSFLLGDAIRQGAQVFVSADFKYHQFFDADGRLVIADIGHYESEQFTRDLFIDLVTKNFVTFAVRLSEVKTNPVHYL